jgi:translation initiation factor 2 beta subunit (eIF-2beta)/eIF-5
MSNTYDNLKQRLIELQNSRKDFLNLKTQKLKLINLPSSEGKLDVDKESNIKKLLNEELSEIDQQFESLASIIETSINIGKSIICPVSEKETILHNVQNTIEILEIEKEIKKHLNELENETTIEKKIEIILKGNKLINKNQNIFKEYQEEFIKKVEMFYPFCKRHIILIKKK